MQTQGMFIIDICYVRRSTDRPNKIRDTHAWGHQVLCSSVLSYPGIALLSIQLEFSIFLVLHFSLNFADVWIVCSMLMDMIVVSV